MLRHSLRPRLHKLRQLTKDEVIVIKAYKKSKFNIFVKNDDQDTIVFNALTGALGKFTPQTFERFEQNNLASDQVEMLLKKGILVDADIDELDKINQDRIEGINNDKLKHFRIWPTSACNARCYYCFEKGIKPTTMTQDISADVVKFIDSRLCQGDKLKVEWFGGEPLLNTKAIEHIFLSLKEICEKKNCEFHSSIISNGSLVDQELAKKMKHHWNIELVQITLDGFGEDYNKAKNYCNPKIYNFDNVIKSVKYLANEGLHVTIRMNYDTTNFDSLAKLINFLHDELKDYKNISYYVYPVWSSIDESENNNFVSTTQADTNLLKLYDLLVANNMGTVRKIARLNYKKHACQAWGKNSLTILPDGKISKCCESYQQILGDIWSGITETKLYDFWTNAKLEDRCSNCQFLPLCQGGCKASYFSRMPQCFMLKPIFNQFLKWYVKHLDNEKQTQNTDN